jgi:hypothetical protein
MSRTMIKSSNATSHHIIGSYGRAQFCYAVVYADGIFGLLHDMMMAARCARTASMRCGQCEGQLALGWFEEADAGWSGLCPLAYNCLDARLPAG